MSNPSFQFLLALGDDRRHLSPHHLLLFPRLSDCSRRSKGQEETRMENPNAILGPYYTRLICSQSELARSNVQQRAGLLMTKIAFFLKILIVISPLLRLHAEHIQCLTLWLCFPFCSPTRSKAPNRIRCLPPPIPFITKSEQRGRQRTSAIRNWYARCVR